MDVEHTFATTVMDTESNAYRISPVGIEFKGDIDHAEWEALGNKLGSATRSLGFLIGDWLNYGEVKAQRGEYSHGEGGIYHDAIRITGLDYTELAKFSSVARKVPFWLRSQNLSFEHHRKVAPLKTDEEKQKWLQVAEKEMEKQGGKTMSSRRLAKSIAKGEVVSVAQLSTPPADRGRENVHPHINRLVAFYGKLKQEDWLNNATDIGLERMLRDLQPVVEIHDEIKATLAQRNAFKQRAG